MRSYSQFVSTLYDETGPVGCIGRGTHYSVLRALAWRSLSDGHPLDTPLIHDLAVVWDEDHDIRIIEILELMLRDNLLYPVIFLGERKAMLSVVLSREFGSDLTEYTRRVAAIAHGLDDPWDAFVQIWTGDAPSTIIADTDPKTAAYLHNIENLWALGQKEFPTESKQMETMAMPPTTPEPAVDAKQFDLAMMEIYRRARKEATYNATRFLQMLHEHGGLETARILLHAAGVSDGYTKLWERDRLDLTVEALVIQPQWRELFTEDERAIAIKRLTDYKYDFRA